MTDTKKCDGSDSLDGLVLCPYCNGVGMWPDGEECIECGGKGKLALNDDDIKKFSKFGYNCTNCPGNLNSYCPHNDCKIKEIIK